MVTEEHIQGHWQRIWLRAPGFEDGTTRVHWMQAGDLYADVRIPLDRPDLGTARCLADLDPEALAVLTDAEGFAGRTVIENSTCTWARDINWHGETSETDAGKLWFRDDGDLIEDGVHADYAERWTRRASSPAEGMHLSSAQGETAFLIRVADWFVFGLGSAAAPSSATCLADLERGKTDLDAVRALFDRVHCVGKWTGETGRAVLATNPFLEGRACLRKAGDTIVFEHATFDGATRDIHLERVGSSRAVA